MLIAILIVLKFLIIQNGFSGVMVLLCMKM